ncbi:penicillin-binding transpeptidase domain-containing protein [Nocardiopsis sp. FIRDI 009]|uniref:penicillin-binding transpeptidase domain-containing protein n=1 Tax=Nocardiopsis sp. FIRDI 009 TaxID=714197 RepID=UPI000E233094|nr:penicillin-binding transpeptidase domain-containing protein [Nocardiopsis sp. FIRDI 009]
MSPRLLGRFAAAGSGVVMAVTLAACTPNPSPEVAVRSFLLAWQNGDHEQAAAFTTGDTGEVASALADVHDQLDLANLRFGLGPIDRDGDSATAEFDVTADLGIGDPTWNYTGRMPLEWGPDGWRISWSPSVVHPELEEGERLAVSYEIQERGQILDRQGRPLVSGESVTAFGVYPGRMDDAEAGVTALAELLGENPGPLLDRVRSAPPEQFQPLVLMRDANVDQALLDQVTAIPGAGAEAVEINLTPSVAPAVLGEVAGTSEHRVSSRVPGPYQAGDTVGLSGLQNIFQNELAGSATTQVVSLDADGEITDVLESWEGDRSGGIGTTLDADVQRSAEAATSAMPGNGYLVAVDVASGEVLAAASATGGTTDDGALTGSYTPGGVFTIVSSLAALESGAIAPDAEMPCGYQTEVGGETFTNPGGGAVLANPTLTANLAAHCTVGFADLAGRVGPDALLDTSERLGLGTEWQLPLPVNTGELSIGRGDAEFARAMNGEQGVQVSPLSMALVAAAVADGTWHAPTLVQEEEPPAVAPTDLDEADLEVVREGMRQAVATRMPSLNLYGEEVYGQATRTEQDGTALHWFVGYRGDVAFAVLAEVNPQLTLTGHYALNAAESFLNYLANGAPEPVAPTLPTQGTDAAAATGDGTGVTGTAGTTGTPGAPGTTGNAPGTAGSTTGQSGL